MVHQPFFDIDLTADVGEVAAPPDDSFSAASVDLGDLGIVTTGLINTSAESGLNYAVFRD